MAQAKWIVAEGSLKNGNYISNEPGEIVEYNPGFPAPRPMVTRLGAHWEGIALLVAGGVGYTAGVPFFVKNGRTLNVPDHTIWHIFVMIGSACHYACVLKYVVNFPYDT